MRLPTFAVLLLVSLGATPAQAQHRPAPLVPRDAAPAAAFTETYQARPSISPAPRPAYRRPRYGHMVAGGVVGGVLGAIVGAGSFSEDRSIGGAILGGGMGAIVGAPIGVHLGNGMGGNPLLTFGAGIGAGAVALSLGVGETDYRFFLPVSGAVALVTAVTAEVYGMRRPAGT